MVVPKKLVRLLLAILSLHLSATPNAAKFLSAVFQPPGVEDVVSRSTRTYGQGWQKAKEGTGSLALGIHFGHYIAGTFNPEILVINVTMANIPLWTGFTYDRWTKGLNIMIEKTTGDFNVEKLQIILLFKADFNANNKWIGWVVMYQAKWANLLAEEQFGSCKFKSAIHQCLNKQLFYDAIWFKQQPAALCLNDAKRCYDCITLLAAALCLCRWGSSQPMVTSMITTLYKMEYHIRTTFSDSGIHASCSTWQAPIAGIRQGNGARPKIWAAVSSPMIDIMWTNGFYAYLMTAISQMDKKMVSFAFVDDTDLCIYRPQVTTHTICNEIQCSIDHWEGLLQATRGALVLTKCFWYMIDFKFTNNTWQYITKTPKLGKISIKDEKQNRVMIPQLKVNEARQTLGVWLALDGNWDMEFKTLLLVTLDWKVQMAGIATQLDGCHI